MIIRLWEMQHTSGDEVLMSCTRLEHHLCLGVYALDKIAESDYGIDQQLDLTTPNDHVLDNGWELLEPSGWCQSCLLVVVCLRVACYTLVVVQSRVRSTYREWPCSSVCQQPL